MDRGKIIVMGFLFFIITFSVTRADWVLWDDFEGHKWKGEGWGGESPQVSWASYDGKKVLQIKFNGTANYGFWRTEYFKDEDWQDVQSIKADVYLQTEGKKPISSKLEPKNHTSVSLEQLWSPAIPPNQWYTIAWKKSMNKDYSTIAMVVMNLEGIQGSALNLYVSNLRLVKSSGEEPWDNFNKKPHDWDYRGAFNPWWSTLGYEVVTHEKTSSVTPAGAGYLSWNYDNKESWAEIAASISEDWSNNNAVRYDVYCLDTTVPLSVYVYDGKTGYEPTPKFVTQAKTWQTMTWNLEYPKDFNPKQIKEFKCVTIELQKHPQGAAYFDNLQVFKK